MSDQMHQISKENIGFKILDDCCFSKVSLEYKRLIWRVGSQELTCHALMNKNFKAIIISATIYEISNPEFSKSF